MKYGCDLSHHQTADAVEQIARKGKAEFVILRTGYGTYSKDIDFERFVKDSEAVGMPNSVYHASYAGTVAEAVEEADFCINRLEATGAKVELPIFYDYEYFSANYNAGRGIVTTKQLVHDLTTAFCERVKARGYRAGVYFNKDYLDRFYGKDYFKAHPDYATWYARPGYSKPDFDCDLWQYASDNGLADFGYNGDIDKNILIDGDILEVEAMKPLSEQPVRMIIGYATSGDIGTLTTYINGLGIDVDVKDGYIITKIPVSKGDQCYIMTEVNKLGNIDCKIYEEPVVQQTEVEQLQAEIAQLTEKNKKLQTESEELAGLYGKVSAELKTVKAELTAANSALAAERGSNQLYTAENAQLKDKLNKIKNIVGV